MGLLKKAPTNFRIVVTPYFRYRDSDSADCRAIADQIKRHCDDVGDVDIIYDTPCVCSHCGCKWTEDSPDYNGGCCEKDQDAEDARIAARPGGLTA